LVICWVLLTDAMRRLISRSVAITSPWAHRVFCPLPSRERVWVRVLHRPGDLLHDNVRIEQDIIVPEPKHSIAPPEKKSSPLEIGFLLR
jgi:hypothetical protein